MTEEMYEQVQLEKLRMSESKKVDEQQSIQMKKLVSNTENNSNHNHEPLFSFDQLLSQIGFGSYQLWIYLIMGLLGVTEGAQITLFTLMIPILKNQWNVPDSLNSLQASFVFVGFLTGSMMSGQFSDRFGRRGPFLYSSFLTCLVTLATILCQDIYQLLFVRGIMGVLVGFFSPCGVTMLSEITQIEVRGRYMSLITLTFSLGQLFGLWVASFFLINFDDGNWRAMTFYCSIPGMLAWILCVLKLQESARFQLLTGKKEESFEIIQQMSKQNNSQFILTDDIKQQLINWANMMNKIAKQKENASIASLFDKDKWFVTCLVWFNWFTLSFIYYGIVMMLPTFLQGLKLGDSYLAVHKLLQLVISSISDIIGAAAASVIIDVKYLGRKNSLVLFFFIQALISAAAYFDDASRFMLWTNFCKFFLSMTFIFSFQYTAEVYSTKIRTTGVGMANGVGRLGGVIMPWICLYLSSFDLLSPFLLFTVISLMTSLTNCFLPYDTLGKEIE
ncbi:unnamed protein product [Paramecium sonneborni]|uniref:Major facilitator superfamily (MFS) profile domain-containing protein n=1 Tax=Paramecium sonneborni TaxID=65129 RepID=A0A8S1P7X0_9CILI|nr:unnamed protein product [Paramecium sonneborni]